MDRYQLVLQRTAQEGDISRVRAVGPGPAGLPAAWRPTTAEAVADWVAKHGPTYHVLPLDTQANVATLAVDQADGQGDGR
jgi:hypothetical protein